VTAQHSRILVLGLGNDILGDDAVGLLAARRLRASLPASVDVLEAAGGGIALLDILEGYDFALLLDSIATGTHPPGSILEFTSDKFRKLVAPSPHYTGVPELLQLAEQLDIPFPKTLRILALEIADPYEIREGLSQSATDALENLVARAKQILDSWFSNPTADTH
jgi:hydrogenase maturation protease